MNNHRMPWVWHLVLAALGLIAQLLIVPIASAQQEKPNILFILADNIGLWRHRRLWRR